MYRGSPRQKECFETIEIKPFTCETCTLSVRMTKLTSSLLPVLGGFWIIWNMDRPVIEVELHMGEDRDRKSDKEEG